MGGVRVGEQPAALAWLTCPTARTTAIAAVALFIGVRIGAREEAAAAAPVPERGSRAMAFASPPKPVKQNRIPTLPKLDAKLPRLGSPEFQRRVQNMGLDPAEVERFARLAKTQDLSDFRK